MRALLLLLCSCAGLAAQQESVTWNFDSLERIGGHAVRVLGDPRVIETERGRAVEFDGGDALFFDVHPLRGAETFTWEVVFRPASGGSAEQRFFHLQENGSETRLLFETRLVEGGWYLDAYANSGGSETLVAPEKLHRLDRWYHLAMVYDGERYSSFVDGRLQASGAVKLAPQGAGCSSAGVRINLVDYFKGAIRWARFTRRALGTDEMLSVESQPAPR